MSNSSSRARSRTRQLLRRRLPAKRSRFLQAEALEPRLALAAEIEPNDSLATAGTFSAATYGADLLDGRINSLYDVDYYKTTLTYGQRFLASYYKPEKFSPELVGGIEILDSQGRVVSSMTDGPEADIYVPKDGTYYVRTFARSDWGDYSGSYKAVAWANSFFGNTEIEPNETSATATELTQARMFRGSLATTADVDNYWFTRNSGDQLSIDFVGFPEDSPAVAVYLPDGSLLARSLDGKGLQATMPFSGNYRIEISANRDNGPVTGQYVAQMTTSYSPLNLIPAAASSFDTAPLISFNSSNYATVLGTLFAINQRQYVAFDVKNYGNPSLLVTSQNSNIRVALYNEYGQIISAANHGDFWLGDQPLTPGRYYASIEAMNATATGPYHLQISSSTSVSQRRQSPLFFIDFNQQNPKYLGYSWVAPFGVPAARDYIQGLFESRYAPWDVEVTQTKPTDRAEYVAHGLGDFGNIGAGGYGSGSPGNNAVTGSGVTQCITTSWTTIGYGCGATLIHEFSHSTGLDHARNVQALLGYDNTEELLPVGTGYSFPITDSRVPTAYQNNPRDYLDWALQSGRHELESASNDTRPTAQALSPLLDEMKTEFTKGTNYYAGNSYVKEMKLVNLNADTWPDLVVTLSVTNRISVLLGTGPGAFGTATLYDPGFTIYDGFFSNILATGDLNGDNIDDVAVTGRSTGTVAVFLANANGTLNAPTLVSAGTNPNTIEIADLNSDGKRDLITGNSDAKVGVHLGNGDGTFQARQQFATTGGSVADLVVAQLNNDSFLDVMTANGTTGTISRLLGNGNGTFATATSLTMLSPQEIVTGDFNGDGRQDVATSDQWGVDVRLQDATGQFGSRTNYSPSQAYPRGLATGDANGDGRDDITYAGWNSVYFLQANANGTFPTTPLITGTLPSEAIVIADLNSDGRADYLDGRITTIYTTFSVPDDLTNNKVVILGGIGATTDVDYYSFTAAAGDKFAFDIESAEFQNPLNAVLSIYDASGILLASNDDALDRDTGLVSVDPYLTHTFATAGTYYVAVTGKNGTVGSYRFKFSPSTSWDDDGPKVIGTLPAGLSTVKTRKQILFFLNDQVDPATLTAANVRVVGAGSGLRSGSAIFDPFESVLIWTADQTLPVDSYSITLLSGASGITDLKGNQLDGETDGSFVFPEISGNNAPGGNFSFQFSVNALDTLAATATATYSRHEYNRGEFWLTFTDEMAITTAPLIARGAGPDATFDTADDRILPLDTTQDIMDDRTRMRTYTRGVPDPDRYRIEGLLEDMSGNAVPLAVEVFVGVDIPHSAFFRDAALTQRGLTGSYINSSLRSNPAQTDWRTTQTIVGTRVDPSIDFGYEKFGSQTEVGLTGPYEFNWSSFSVQWDGFLQVPVAGAQLHLYGYGGGRLWIDWNNDGVFESSGPEYVDNHWGSAGGSTTSGAKSPAFTTPGVYRVRVQYECVVNEPEQVHLDWITPDLSGQVEGLAHGPSVIDTNLQPGSFTQAGGIQTVDVYFSGAIDPATLTTDNFRVRYSSDPIFYNGGETHLTDADGVIAWDPVLHKATLQPAQPLIYGSYLIELNGDAGGIADRRGFLLDGEYLDSYIAGNDSPFVWRKAPSGNGLAGGDYVAMFSLSNFTAAVSASAATLPEDGASNFTFTFTRTGDVALPGVINFTVGGTATPGSDYAQSGIGGFTGTSGLVSFGPGQTSTTITIDPTADSNGEVDETVVITITSNSNYNIGASGSATATIRNDDQFLITASAATSTGVVLDFNRALDISQLNIFDATTQGRGVADLTLVGATTGNIRGSAVLSSNQRRLTFVSTEGRLPVDSYTFTLRSASDGSRDQAGVMLDGDANGSDGGHYTYNFNIAAPPAGARTLSVPNVSRGPGQALNLQPAGLPISLSSAAGITGAMFEVRYDPALLTISGATVAPGISGASVDISTLTPGVTLVQFASSAPLPAGTTRFIDLQAAVPSSATYRGKQVLDLANISLNGGSIPALDDDAVQIVGYFGDVTGNGTYSAQDAALIARLAVGIDAGLEQYRLLDPVILGDITGNGGFSGSDTSKMLQASVGIDVPEIPGPLPNLSLTQGGPDPKLSIPANLAAAAGGQLLIPLNIDSIVDLTGNGLTSADLVIYYDPAVLEITAAQLGTLVANRGWLLSSRIDPLAGRIDLSLAGTAALEGFFRGQLVQLTATVKADAPAGASAINLAATSRSRTTQLNEGFLTLIPAPTDAANDPVDGRVMITRPSAAPAQDIARVVGDRLLITGTAGDDRIFVGSLGDNRVQVRIGHELLGTFVAPGGIAIDAKTGDDFIYVDPAVPAAVIGADVNLRDRFFAADQTPLLPTASAPPPTTQSPATQLPPGGLTAHETALLQLLASWQEDLRETQHRPAVRTAVRRIQ